MIGELVPKSLAILKPEQVSRWTAQPMAVFFTVAYPALYVLNGASNLVLKAFGLTPARESETKHSSDEIRLIVEASFGSSDKERIKRELLERVLRATDRPVRALMLPRVDMHTLSLSQTLDEWLIEIRKSGYSRYPVTQEGNADHIRGYVYVKDLLLAQTPPRNGLRGLLRDLLFVPESLPLGEVLSRFRRTNIPIAIVVDEYGGTSVLVRSRTWSRSSSATFRTAGRGRSQVRGPGRWHILVDGSVPLGTCRAQACNTTARIAADTVGATSSAARTARAPGRTPVRSAAQATVEDMRRRPHRAARVPGHIGRHGPPPHLAEILTHRLEHPPGGLDGREVVAPRTRGRDLQAGIAGWSWGRSGRRSR